MVHRSWIRAFAPPSGSESLPGACWLTWAYAEDAENAARRIKAELMVMGITVRGIIDDIGKSWRNNLCPFDARHVKLETRVPEMAVECRSELAAGSKRRL